MSRFGISLVSYRAALILLAAAAGRCETDRMTVLPATLIPRNDYKAITRAVYRDGQFLLLDNLNHRLLVLDAALQYRRQVSQIGQDPGALYKIYDVAIDHAGNLYVLDQDGRRIQEFAWNGALTREVVTPGLASTLAVTSKGEILACIPTEGSLVSVIDKRGRVIRKFGKLKRLSELYGASMAPKNEIYKIGINRVRISVDSVDDVYLAFEGAPVIQKYNPSGGLIFEKRLAGPEADQIVATFRETSHSPIHHAYPNDGLGTPYVITGLEVNRERNLVFVCTQWDRGWIYLLDTKGETRKILDWSDRHLLFQKPFFSEKRGTLILPALSSKLGAGVYELDLGFLGVRPQP